MLDRKANGAQEGAQLILLILLVLGMTAAVMRAHAITPPTPTAPKQATVIYKWTPDPLRADLVTPLPASERKEARLYITSLSAYIAVPEPATTYTYVVPWGQCIKSSDAAQVTQVDTLGQEGAASDPKSTSADACSLGKPLPNRPTGVTISIGS